MQYESYTLRRTASRTVYGIYDNLAGRPLCRRDDGPYTSVDRHRINRLAAQLNTARDAASIASALIDFGATQSDAWRYAQSVRGLTDA